MKTLFTFTLILFATTLFAQKVTSDYDKDTDFSGYKTYQFLGWQNDSDEIMNDLDKNRLRDAFKAEMDARNMVLSENGDMAISLFIVVDHKTSTTAYSNYYGGSNYRYRRGGSHWGGGYATTTYTENDYLEGTLVMDVFDAESKEQIWQAVAKGTIMEKPEKRAKSIPKTVGKLMKKFPIPKAK